jgi:predicted DNA-binding transcriptional regulator YafY
VNTKFATIDYTNWRGERRARSVRPIRIEWGSNRWHPEPQWLLVAYDEENNAERTFAMQSIHSFAHQRDEATS